MRLRNRVSPEELGRNSRTWSAKRTAEGWEGWNKGGWNTHRTASMAGSGLEVTPQRGAVGRLNAREVVENAKSDEMAMDRRMVEECEAGVQEGGQGRMREKRRKRSRRQFRQGDISRREGHGAGLCRQSFSRVLDLHYRPPR